MLNIALCDDEPIQLAIAQDLIQQYIKQRRELNARLTVFSSGVELLAKVEDGSSFDLYILDVIMPQMTGIQVGQRLRSMGRSEPIIYLTSSAEYAVDSYLAQAFYYFLKPVEPVRFFQVLDNAVALLQNRRASAIQVKTKKGTVLLPMDDIQYVELERRTSKYHLNNGDTVQSVTFHGSFQGELAPLLADSRFVMCASSFAVNLHYVTVVDKKELIIAGGRRVPVSRGFHSQLKGRWTEYWQGGSGGNE